MTAPAVIRKKAQRLTIRLKKIEKLVDGDLATFEADEARHDLCAFYLILAIEDCVDLAEHLTAEHEWRTPESAGDEFDCLASHQVITPSLAKRMREAVGMRNLLVHQYADTRWSYVFAAANDLSRLREFLAAILTFSHLDSPDF